MKLTALGKRLSKLEALPPSRFEIIQELKSAQEQGIWSDSKAGHLARRMLAAAAEMGRTIGGGADMELGHLPRRCYGLKPTKKQRAYWEDETRYVVTPCGRRSGKTEIAKRRALARALRFYKAEDGRIAFAAPVRDQAKTIFWKDLKAMVPRFAVADWDSDVMESELTIRLINGVTLFVVGMDKPERVEGSPLDGIVLDEYGNMKPDAWDAHVGPALSGYGREGWADFTGTPEGRNHYYKLYEEARKPANEDLSTHHWESAEVLDPKEVESARRRMDPILFAQEYLGSFVSFAGRAYYRYEVGVHDVERCEYDPRVPLLFCFDFNVEPGTASVWQKLRYRGPGSTINGTNKDCEDFVYACIGEVWIPRNSRTDFVCARLIQDWSHHEGQVICYGDPTGGNRGTAKTDGSDWDIIANEFRAISNWEVDFRVKNGTGPERPRLNATNGVFRATAGNIRGLVDSEKAPHMAVDFEGVRILEGGTGEIDKKADKELTHLSDGAAYMFEFEEPIFDGGDLIISSVHG